MLKPRLVKQPAAPAAAPVRLTGSQMQQVMTRVVLELRQQRQARIEREVAAFRKL